MQMTSVEILSIEPYNHDKYVKKMWIAFKILNTDNGKYNSPLPTLYFQLLI